jgi:transcriptional regulator with XRE-family HTH domain
MKSQSDIYERLSRNVKRKVRESGMSQNSIAKKLGVTRGNFSVQINSGTMKIRRLYSLASILGCDISEFFE